MHSPCPEQLAWHESTMSFILITNSFSCCWWWKSVALESSQLGSHSSVSHLPVMKRNEIRKQQARVSQSVSADIHNNIRREKRPLKSRNWWDELGLLNVCVPQICRRKQLMEFVLLSLLAPPARRRTQIDNCELSIKPASAGSNGLLHLHSAALSLG